MTAKEEAIVLICVSNRPKNEVYEAPIYRTQGLNEWYNQDKNNNNKQIPHSTTVIVKAKTEKISVRRRIYVAFFSSVYLYTVVGSQLSRVTN